MDTRRLEELLKRQREGEAVFPELALLAIEFAQKTLLPEVVTLYVTYGCGSYQRDCFSKVEAETLEEAYDKIAEVTKGKYAFTYDQAHFEGVMSRHKLQEIPLRPHAFPLGEES